MWKMGEWIWMERQRVPCVSSPFACCRMVRGAGGRRERGSFVDKKVPLSNGLYPLSPAEERQDVPGSNFWDIDA